MPIEIREAEPHEIESLVPLLLLAEPSLPSLRWSLRNLSDAVYRLDDDGELAGAATVRWEGDPCEIVELAVAEPRQGQGLGRALVEWLLGEARRRGKGAMEVGTSNASLGNIAFYQKVGFRMDHVRKGYFWYDRSERVENGIPVRDLLVFRYALTPEEPPRGRRRGA
jgi:GNAT superfamily N-acetyltransferase